MLSILFTILSVIKLGKFSNLNLVEKLKKRLTWSQPLNNDKSETNLLTTSHPFNESSIVSPNEQTRPKLERRRSSSGWGWYVDDNNDAGDQDISLSLGYE